MRNHKIDLNKLRAEVKAAEEEFTQATAFHEVWKPAAYDESVYSQMDHTHAGHAFLVIRSALRREMLLALMRLWDKSEGTVRLESIARFLRRKDLMDALVDERVAKLGDLGDNNYAAVGIRQAMIKALQERADAALGLIDKYSKDGAGYQVRAHLMSLRHEQFAHRSVAFAAPFYPAATNDEIEEFYQDVACVVEHLQGVINATAQSMKEFAEVFRHYSTRFWEGVRSEKIEGHPSYRAPPKQE